MKRTKPPQTLSSPSSSSSCSCSIQSNTTENSTPMEDEEEEEEQQQQQNDVVPGCRRDANCNCSICLESIKSTLDLMPMSAQRSSLSKLSASRPLIVVEKTPISIDPTLLSTPTSRSRLDPNPIRVLTPTPFRSTAKSAHPKQKSEPRSARRSFRGSRCRIIGKTLMFLSLFLVVEFGGSWLGFRVLGPPRLSSVMVEKLVQGSLDVDDLVEKFRVLELGLKEGYGLDRKVSSCAAENSTWKINGDGLLLNSRCTIYKSSAEEVAIWGWPLQTAGLLTASFSARMMTVISGRVIEWGNGGIGYVVARNASSTWVMRKWGGSAVQLDPNTWVLEYKRSMLFDNPRLLSAVGDLMRFMVSAVIRRVRQELWSECSHCGGEAMTIPRPNYGIGSIPT